MNLFSKSFHLPGDSSTNTKVFTAKALNTAFLKLLTHTHTHSNLHFSKTLAVSHILSLKKKNSLILNIMFGVLESNDKKKYKTMT